MYDFLYNWGPMLLLIAVWIYFVRKGGTLQYKQHVEEMKRLATEQLGEMRKTNECLARIERLLQERRV